MTQPKFARDIVFEQIYQKRVQKMTDAHIAATGSNIFNQGIVFGINTILDMIKTEVDITDESIGAAIQKRMTESVKVVQEQKAEPVVTDGVPEKKPFKLERIK